jgi:hypothetical protein
MFDNPIYLEALNINEQLDFFTGYNRVYQDNAVYDNPYYAMQISSIYDIESLSGAEFVKSKPIYLSINIQSLQSKFEQLCIELNEFAAKNITIDNCTPRNMGRVPSRVICHPWI